jgi:ribosomal protein S25
VELTIEEFAKCPKLAETLLPPKIAAAKALQSASAKTNSQEDAQDNTHHTIEGNDEPERAIVADIHEIKVIDEWSLGSRYHTTGKRKREQPAVNL